MMQHNVLTWRGRNHELSNTYSQINPHIILLNSHGVREDEPLRIPGYRVHRSNKHNRHLDGTDTAIKNTLQNRLMDDFLTNKLAIKIQTATGKIIIATDYITPSRSTFKNSSDVPPQFSSWVI